MDRGPWFSVVDPTTFSLSTLPRFCENSGPVGFVPNMSPYDYFEKFVETDTGNVFNIIQSETNMYASQNKNNNARDIVWQPVTVREVKAFFGLLLTMGIVRKPTIASYWETTNGLSLWETPNFSKVMSRNRFQAILKFLHCNNNDRAMPRGQPGYDPLFKIRPVLDVFTDTFSRNYSLPQNITIDERMIGFKGRHFMKQYLPDKKANRWGIKVWILADSRTGYSHNIKIYTGKHNAPRHSNGQGYKVVMDLMRPHLNRNHHLTVDNWFASPKLFHDLRDSNTYATGTCLKSRIGMPKSFKTTNLPRGQMCVKSQGNLMAILYSDRKHVTVITTTGRARMLRQTNSRGKQVRAPEAVHRYNYNMGGVDVGDQMLLRYEPNMKSMKMWRKMLIHLIMTATVNAYICYKLSDQPQEKMQHVEFQKRLIEDLVGNFRQESYPMARRQARIGSTRLTERHFIDKIPAGKRMKCAVCTGDGFSGSRIRTWCPDCQVGLCVGRCFRVYHTRVSYEE